MVVAWVVYHLYFPGQKALVYERNIRVLVVGFLFNQNISAQFFKKDAGLAHTFSIVAKDPVTGEMAVGVQSAEYQQSRKPGPLWTILKRPNTTKAFFRLSNF